MNEDQDRSKLRATKEVDVSPITSLVARRKYSVLFAGEVGTLSDNTFAIPRKKTKTKISVSLKV